MTTLRTPYLAVSALMMALSASCSFDIIYNNNNEANGDSTSISLKDVNVPGNFRFETSKIVSLELSANRNVFLSGRDGFLTIRNASNNVLLYSGALQADSAVELKLSLPQAARQIDAILATRSGTRQRTVLIDDDGIARIDFNDETEEQNSDNSDDNR